MLSRLLSQTYPGSMQIQIQALSASTVQPRANHLTTLTTVFLCIKCLPLKASIARYKWSIVSNIMVVQRIDHFLFTSLMPVLVPVSPSCWQKQNLPFYLSHPEWLVKGGEARRQRKTHPSSSNSLSPMELLMGSHGGPHTPSEPLRVFKGTDKIQEIDGIIELLVLEGNGPNRGASENK